MREWKGINSAAFDGLQRHAMDAVSTQLDEISASLKRLSQGREPVSAGDTLSVSTGLGNVSGVTSPVTDQDIVAYWGPSGFEITRLSGVQGDVLYYNGTNWTRLAAGTSGYFLKTNGAGANPAWADAPTTKLKKLWLPPAVWAGAAVSTVGTAPNIASRISLPQGVDTSITTTFTVPLDMDVAATWRMLVYYAPTGTDTNTVSLDVYAQRWIALTDDITASHDDSVSANYAPGGTANIVETIECTGAINSIIVAGEVYRLVVRRSGPDGNSDDQSFLGVMLEYTLK